MLESWDRGNGYCRVSLSHSSVSKGENLSAHLFRVDTGYHYIANVTLEIYRAPLEVLVEEMSKALRTLRVSHPHATRAIHSEVKCELS